MFSAEPRERPGVNSESHTGFLVRFVETSDSLKLLLGDAIHELLGVVTDRRDQGMPSWIVCARWVQGTGRGSQCQQKNHRNMLWRSML